MKPTDKIKNLIAELKDTTGNDLDQRILNDTFAAMDNSKQHSTQTPQSVWRIIMKSRTTRLTTAAAALIMIMIGMYNLTGSIDGISTAFANAMEHLAAAETARFDLTIKFGDQEPQTSSFRYDAKGYIWQNMASGTLNFVDYNLNKILSIVPDSETAIIRNVDNPDFSTSLYNIFSNLQDLIQQAIVLGDGPVESLGTKNIDGHTAYGYSIETTGQSPGMFWQGKGTLTIWADAETDFPLILKWHSTMTDITVTVTNIKLNVNFTPDETELIIPDGYTIRDESIPPQAPEPEPEETQQLQEGVTEPENISESGQEQDKSNEIVNSNITGLVEGLDENDQTMIKFFHSWAAFAKDKFPSSLTLDAIKDIDPDAKISFKQGLWSGEFSAEMPNLFAKWTPDIDPNDYTKEQMLQAEDKQGPYYQEIGRQFQIHFKTYQPHFKNIVEGLKFINKLPAKSDWHYNGQDATLDDTDTAIFWYKPRKSETYRVIYGDLTTEDIDPEDLHLLENLPDEEIDRQANAVLETAIQLGADIPKDKRNTVFRMLSLKEKDLIKGLATYLEYSPGKYPSTLEMKKDFIVELDSTLSEAFKNGLVDKKISKEETLDIGFAAFFYDKLVREKKDPAYYGATATITYPNAILVRWKLSKNKYRVIYTNLKAKTLSAKKLAELESKLNK